ncbi:hypothetical protein FEM48_Zijuj01G0202600 [Ziziphus jujuba var. spinosa]|uniref:Bulb-type lectin domain-containing protein n=1 Tax=Ziziphus jujuba var. spinosa TaxID=714518 RepID=A0A978W3C1_ZIZJJ|nr:hypothetical protein FEM48_Zijuj01G0202600 [Ziziphus jujuba var. spinosa]
MKMGWVANRDTPLTNIVNNYWILDIGAYRNLVLSDGNSTSITINSESPAMSSNTVAILLDTGNLVLKAGEHILWLKQQPHNHFLTSWVSLGVSALGAFTLGLDPNAKQLVPNLAIPQIKMITVPVIYSSSWIKMNIWGNPHVSRGQRWGMDTVVSTNL